MFTYIAMYLTLINVYTNTYVMNDLMFDHLHGYFVCIQVVSHITALTVLQDSITI